MERLMSDLQDWFEDHHEGLAQLARGEEGISCMPSLRGPRWGACEFTLQLMDLAQSWSGVPGAQSLHFLPLVASLSLHHGVFDVAEELTGRYQGPYQPNLKVKSFTKKL